MNNNHEPRSVGRSILRGLFRRCPNCGMGRVFGGYLKPARACGHCGEGYAHIRTDDFAPWLTIIVMGHILAPIIFHVEVNYSPPTQLALAFWIPAVVILTLILLPLTKGVCLGFMWALRLRGDEMQ
ncbi:MAG: hypothetical protein CMM74_12720 [Rhodospirillaceae bacterium]|nr:hypothetical protein [Rhodospirillaceae bacterium]MDP6927180.1 DUF983 domain-containing protein [Rhodospirillales bacterium]